MTGKQFATAASTFVLGLGLWLTPGQAQGPMYDRVDVNLPYAVTLGDTTLQPGDYTIKELPSQNKERVLLIYSDKGVKHEATVMTIPAYQNQTPDDTKVVLHHYGPDYYFDKIWVTGKNYGYEFPVPDSVKARQREREQPVSVAASYQAPPTQTAAAPAPAPAPVPEPRPQVAENTPPAAAAPAPAPPENQVAQNTPPPAPADNSANRDATPAADNKTLPSTSAGWVMMLLGGGGLSGVGYFLRKRS
jgi:hypothetical protein